MFMHEFDVLKNGGSIVKGFLADLAPYVDNEGILRVGGRLRRAPISEEAKHQIVLPKKHHLTDLIVSHEHRRKGHIGPAHVLSELRQEFWVIHGKSVVKRIIKKCFFCKIRRAKIMFPYMADLPVGRTSMSNPPFSHCGVDLFGPIMIKQGRKKLKRYGVLFTCLTVRCVHLEVVETAETDTFINALRRFVNRRGSPLVIYSDNGTNFKGASAELAEFRESLDKKKIETFCADVSIKWIFNPPSAPHMGGIWERLVRSTKEVLMGLVNEKTLTDDQLYTVLTEVESILNSRPITHLSDDVNDLEPITPNHILLGLHKKWSSIATSNERDVVSRKKWRQVQAISKMFWSRWQKEYLPEITKRSKWTEKTNGSFKEGELVLVLDDMTRKGSWNLGRLTELKVSDDGIVRVVKVKTKNGTYTRPVAKIAKLEDNE